MAKATTFNYKINVNKKSKHPYWWNCIANNMKIRCHSEGYSTKDSAVNAVCIEIRNRIDGVCSYEDLTGGVISSRIERVMKEKKGKIIKKEERRRGRLTQPRDNKG